MSRDPVRTRSQPRSVPWSRGEPIDMTSNDANGVAKEMGRPSFRRDDAGKPTRNGSAEWWARLERGWWKAFVGAVLVFSAVPVINHLLELGTKDYDLWYKTGVALRHGL